MNWKDIETQALEGLAQSKDLHLLAYLAAASLRTGGLAEFCEALGTARQWLDAYWDDVYPRIEEDALLRRNALNCFADPVVIVERLLRMPLVTSRRYGAFSLRDIENVEDGRLRESCDRNVSGDDLDGAFEEFAVDELRRLRRRVVAAVDALEVIQRKLDRADPVMPPAFGPLQDLLLRLSQVLHGRMAARSLVDGPEDEETAGETAAFVSAADRIGSRGEALRELDRLTEFVQRTAPASPVPVLLARARRLLAADFIDVLADIPIEGAAPSRTPER